MKLKWKITKDHGYITASFQVWPIGVLEIKEWHCSGGNFVRCSDKSEEDKPTYFFSPYKMLWHYATLKEAIEETERQMVIDLSALLKDLTQKI